MHLLILSGVAVLLVFGFIFGGGLFKTQTEHLSPLETQPVSSTTPLVSASPAATAPLRASLPPIPAQKTLSPGTHVFQTFNNCGPASLTMALSYFGITVTQQEVGSQIRPYQIASGDNDDKSVTLAELAAFAEEKNLLTYHRPAGNMNLVKQFIAADIPVITRTWLEPGEDIGHYRVIVGYDENRGILIQDDSLQGNDLEYTYAAYNELWQAFNYEFLVLVPQDKKEEAELILGALVDKNVAWEMALGLADQQLKTDDSDIYAHFNRAVALYELGQYEESVAAYERVASRLPRRMLWYQIEPILAYYKTNKFDQVLSMSQTIFESQNRAFSELYYIRGLIFESRNQPEQAAEAFSLADRYNSSSYWKANLSSL